MPSIRGKVYGGYLVLAVAVGIFATLAAADLRFLEKRVQEGFAITTFQASVLELRRHEKNYFLYRSRGEGAIQLALARESAAHLRERLDSREIRAAIAESEIQALTATLDRYRALLAKATPLDRELRAVGQEILQHGEQLAERERTTLATAVRDSRQMLLWAAVVLVVVALVCGRMLYRAVGRPLQALEHQLEPLARGEFRAFSMVSRDREIVSFTQALNRMLDELDLRRRQLMQSEKLASLGTLASGVAHELNNPLGNISSAAQILLEDVARLPAAVQEGMRGWLAQIDDEARRAHHIVRTVLDYSRHSAHGIESVSLRAALDRSLILLNPCLPEEDSVSIDMAADIRVDADPRHLQQVFINLIQNSFDAGARQVRIAAAVPAALDWPPRGSVALGKPVPTAPAALIRITDDGSGIGAEEIGKVFDPFYTTRPPGEGTGLGLYVVGEIVQDLGGGIAVSSAPASGTRFSIWLPCRREAQP
ncbi:MAG: signal transduction histidine kinase [Rhodocyclaceae bacterium]|nr:signal transduction histidine kinase [Rhodocyclaceae bacterium]